MYGRILRAALVGGSTIISVAGFGCSAQAFTLTDTYSGGLNTYNPNTVNGDGKGDVIGDVNLFNTTSVDVTRIATVGGDDLKVVIHTNYAANPGALGTGFGSLFLSTTPVTLAGPAPYTTDTFAANPGRFNYVLTMPPSPGFVGGTATGGASLYHLNGTGSDVQLSYFPNPNDTSGGNFRNDQAVQFKGNQAALAAYAGSAWTVDELAKTITFILKNENDLLGDDFALQWAMTCANDVILGNIQIPDNGPNPPGTPLPGALSLFAGGLGILGFLGSRRKKRVVEAQA
jgi:hypothetical protein